MDSKKIWESVLVDIEINVSKANFNTWFKDTYIYKFEDGVVFLSVPNNFVKEWLVKKFHSYILKSLRNLSENVRSLDYVVSKGDIKKKEPEHTKGLDAFIESTHELPLNEFYINNTIRQDPYRMNVHHMKLFIC